MTFIFKNCKKILFWPKISPKSMYDCISTIGLWKRLTPTITLRVKEYWSANYTYHGNPMQVQCSAAKFPSSQSDKSVCKFAHCIFSLVPPNLKGVIQKLHYRVFLDIWPPQEHCRLQFKYVFFDRQIRGFGSLKIVLWYLFEKLMEVALHLRCVILPQNNPALLHKVEIFW